MAGVGFGSHSALFGFQFASGQGQLFGRFEDKHLAQHGRRLAQRGVDRGDRVASPCAVAIAGAAMGVALHYLELFPADAQLFRPNLGNGGVDALPHFGFADKEAHLIGGGYLEPDGGFGGKATGGGGFGEDARHEAVERPTADRHPHGQAHARRPEANQEAAPGDAPPFFGWCCCCCIRHYATSCFSAASCTAALMRP